MKNTIFLTKTYKENKLSLVEPSEEIMESYLKKSEDHFESAKILLKFGKLEESISMAYYGMYHCLQALLFKCGIKCENHTASIILLKELFKEQELAKIISFAKKERIDRQYYVDFSITESDAKEMILKAQDLITSCRLLIKRLTLERIDTLREELKTSLK